MAVQEAVALPRETTKSRSWILPLVLLLFAQFIELIDSSSFTPVMPLITQAWNMNYSQIGLFAGMVGLMGLIVCVPYGEFMKRVGIRNAVLLALGVVAVGMVVIAMAPNFTQGAIGRAFATAGYRAGSVALYAGIALTAPAHVRGSMMGIMLAMASLASIIGTPLIGGYVGTNYGWEGVFWTMAALAAVGTVVFGLFFRNPATPQAAADAGPAEKDRSIYKTWDAWMLTIVTGLLGAGATVVLFFVPMSLATQFGWKTPEIAFFITLCWVAAMPGQLLSGYISDRLKSRKVVILACAAPIIPLSLAFNSNNATVVAGAGIAILALILWANPPLQTAPAEMFSRRQLAVVYGMMTTGMSAAGYFMPQALGVMRDATGGFTVGWYFLAGVAVICCVAIWRLKIR